MRSVPSDTLTRTGVIAVLRAADARLYEPVVNALAESGVLCIELTMTTPGTLEMLPQVIADAPETEIGVGTVLTAHDARAALEAGARFLVSPTVSPEVIDVADSFGAAVYPGALTPTEVHAAWERGATAVKVFPAVSVGSDYVRQLAGPLPHLLTLPSGGVTLEDIPEWIRAGCIAVSLGGPLIGDAFTGGSLDALKERARRALAGVVKGRTA